MVIEENARRSKTRKDERQDLHEGAPAPVASLLFAQGRSIRTLGGHGGLLRFELLVSQCTIHLLIQALALASLATLATPAVAAESSPTETTPAAVAESSPTETTPAAAAESSPTETTPATVSDSDPTNEKLVLVILSFLGGAFVATIGAIITLAATQRRIQMNNVVAERAKWRDKIRCLTSEVHEAIMEGEPAKRRSNLLKLKVKFRVVLNPHDCEDEKILKVIADAYKCKCRDECECTIARGVKSDIFSMLVSYLLKHDWERAKEEVKNPIFQWWTPRRGEHKSECLQETSQDSEGDSSSAVCVKIRKSDKECPTTFRNLLRECFHRKNSRFRYCKVIWTSINLVGVLAALFLIFCYFLLLAYIFTWGWDGATSVTRNGHLD